MPYVPHWRPLLEGTQTENAQATAMVIGRTLSTVSGLQGAWASSYTTCAHQVSLLHHYLAAAFPGAGHDAIAAHAMDDAVERLARIQLSPALYGGFTDVAWVAEHTQCGPDRVIDGEDINANIDAALSRWLNNGQPTRDYDLISGLVGYGVYLLERLTRPSARALLVRVVELLAETAEHRPEGVTWFTPAAALPAWQRAFAPAGYYNLGVAHGVPAVVAFLGQVWQAGLARDTVEPLMRQAAYWVLAQQLGSHTASAFPYWVIPDQPVRSSRLAWCYGDLGVAGVLFCAACCCEDSALEEASLSIARRAAVRPLDQCGVLDAGLCHGAAGLAHMFNRLFQATDDATLGDAARRWFAKTLEMRRPGHGIGGYQAWGPVASRMNNPAMGWVDDISFLTGAVGIALALLAASTPVEPQWDRLLLLSAGTASRA